MCLAYPGKIVKIENKKRALVDFSGMIRRVNVELVKRPKIGDYVNVHAGFAIQKLGKEDALEVLRFYEKPEGNNKKNK